MSSHSLADITQSDWIRACQKLRMLIIKNRGKGSHILIAHPNGQKITVQKHLYKIVNQKIFSTLIQLGFEEENVWDSLRK